MKSPVTCHVLDTTHGKPANGISVNLLKAENEGLNSWNMLASGVTDSDGRCSTLLTSGTQLEKGVYKMRFDGLEKYFETRGSQSFYPYAEIVFKYEFPQQHYHIPLLLSPFGYTTYRGS